MASALSIQNDSNTAYFDNFTCIICLEVLQEPVQCVKNEHYFCKKCITKHLKRSQTCPLCQDNLTYETLRPIPRAVANILEQFQSQRCKYASRGCTSAVRREALSSHHEECDFAPVKCSYDSCEATVNRQDLVSHQQACEFRSVTYNDCQEAMRQREYRKHPCAFRNELDESKRGLAEVWRVLRELQDEQLRQGEEMRQMARELRQPHTTQGQRDNNLRQQTSGRLGQQASETVQPNPTRRQQSDNSKQPDSTQPQHGYNRIPTGLSCMNSDYIETVLIPSPIQSKATVNKQIVVAGGGRKSSTGPLNNGLCTRTLCSSIIRTDFLSCMITRS